MKKLIFPYSNLSIFRQPLLALLNRFSLSKLSSSAPSELGPISCSCRITRRASFLLIYPLDPYPFRCFQKEFWAFISQQAKGESIMGKTGGYYAVARGKSVGIFQTWDSCKAQVDGFKNARYKKFASIPEAEAFIQEHSGGTSSGSTNVDHASSSKLGTREIVDLTFGDGNDASEVSIKFAPSVSNSVGGFTKHKPNNRKAQLIDLVPNKPSSTIPNSSSNGIQQRTFSTSSVLDKRALRVTEDIVTGSSSKRLKISDDAPKVDLSKFNVDELGYVTVFTDGACTANGRKGALAGIGVWFGDSHPLNISEPVKGRQTNNTAEIQAAERAILQAKKTGIFKIKLKTDSQFTINCATKWLGKWKRNGWKLATGSDVKNKEDLEKLDSAMQGIEIKWSYVAGHKGHYGNEEADRLAVEGAKRGR